MASNNQPDVRVRLSAEGVDEVVKAFERTQKAAESSAHGVELLKGVTEQLRGTMEALGVGLSVAGLLEFGKSALENAEHMQTLSERLGVGTERLSVLSLAAREAGMDQDFLGSALSKLARNQDLAASGSTKQIDAFRRLGIGMAEVRKQDPGEMFVTVADKLTKVESGTARAAIAQTLLGKSGSELIPIMNKLANGGYDEVAAKAQRLGVIIDGDLAKAATRATEDMRDLDAMAQGAAIQFLTGFAPDAAQAMETFEQAVMGKGVNGLKTLGEWAGKVTRGIVFGFIVAGQTVATAIAYIEEKASHAKDTAKGVISGLVSGGVMGAAVALAPSNDREAAIFDEYGKGLLKALDDFNKPASDPSNKKDKKRDGGVDDGGGNLTKIQQARIAFLKAGIDNELALSKTRNTLVSQENDRDYKDGLVDLATYYDKRSALINTAAFAEEDALKKKLALEKQEPANDQAAQYKKDQGIAALQTQIDNAELKRKGDLKALDEERTQAEKVAGEAMLALNAKIAQAEGDRFKAARLNLDAELTKLDEELAKLGVSADARRAQLTEFKSASEGKIGFDQNTQQGGLAIKDLDLQKRSIQRQSDQGAISGIEAQGRINAVEQEELQHLRDIGAEMTKNAAQSKDPALIQQAKAYNSSLDDMDAALHRVTSTSAFLTQSLATTGRADLETFFTDGITGAKSFGQAWSDLGKGFEKIVAGMIAQLVSFYLMLLLLKAINPTAADALEAQGPFSGKGFARGGYTGDGGKHQMAGIVHKGEFVWDQDTTKRYRPLLQALSGGSVPSLTATRSSYAAGGYVTGESGGSPVEVNIHNHTGQQVSSNQRTGSDGNAILDIVIGAVASDIAKGGRTAQALQSTYGVSRAGIKRG